VNPLTEFLFEIPQLNFSVKFLTDDLWAASLEMPPRAGRRFFRGSRLKGFPHLIIVSFFGLIRQRSRFFMKTLNKQAFSHA